MDLTTTAEELYSLLPGDFTATRNAKAKEANQSGDKDLGKQIRGLPKPSMAAWLVNMLVRRRAEEIDGLLELGASLRQAQENLDQKQLRDLAGQRHELLSALVERARSLADDLDQNVSDAVADDVEQTLHAAMADVDAADAVASGMLTRALASTGWDPVDLEGAVAVPDTVDQAASAHAPSQPSRSNESSDSPTAKRPAKGKKTTGKQSAKDEDARQTTEDPEDDVEEPTEEADEEPAGSRQAKSDLEEAEQRLEEAEARQQSLEEQLEEADSRQEGLMAEIDELKKRLEELERERKAVDSEVDRLESDQDDAVHAAKDARRAARRARRRVKELS